MFIKKKTSKLRILKNDKKKMSKLRISKNDLFTNQKGHILQKGGSIAPNNTTRW